MGPTWVLSAPDGPHVGPMNIAIKEAYSSMPELRHHWRACMNNYIPYKTMHMVIFYAIISVKPYLYKGTQIHDLLLGQQY